MEKQSRLHELLDEISLRLIEGQYLDISYERRFDVSVQEYLTMIGGKTAALISGSMEMGAYLGTETASCIASIRDIGRNLGLAFQIRDDILGIWGKEKETGKPTGNDILRRKKSFPVVFALENAGNSKRKELVSIYRNSLMDQPTVNRVLEIFDSVNTCVKAQETVAQYCSESLKAFNDLPVSSQAKLEMKELVEFLTSREW